MKHRAQTISGEWIVGWYYMVNGDHYIRKSQYDFYKIKPETLAIETLKLDSNGEMIFGSFELDGVMTQGGDVVESAFKMHVIDGKYSVKYSTNDSAFMGYLHREGEPVIYELSDFWDNEITIIGKQSEVVNDK